MTACRAIILSVLFITVTASRTEGSCSLPAYMRGSWFYMEYGRSKTFTVSENDNSWNVQCEDVYTHVRPAGADPQLINQTFLLASPDMHGPRRCFTCMDVLQRSANVIQFTRGTLMCFNTPVTIEVCFEGVKRLPGMATLTTMYRQGATEGVSCSPTLAPGRYQFTYERDIGGGGICNSSDSLISAPAAHNESFTMNFAKCDDVSKSNNHEINFRCLATWSTMPPYYGPYANYMIIEDVDENDPREKYKCLMTMTTAEVNPTVRRFGMSRFADCSRMSHIYSVPVRLVLTKLSPQ